MMLAWRYEYPVTSSVDDVAAMQMRRAEHGIALPFAQTLSYLSVVSPFCMCTVFQLILMLYQPLSYLGTYYRMIKQSMIDVETMVCLRCELQCLHASIECSLTGSVIASLLC